MGDAAQEHLQGQNNHRCALSTWPFVQNDLVGMCACVRDLFSVVTVILK